VSFQRGYNGPLASYRLNYLPPPFRLLYTNKITPTLVLGTAPLYRAIRTFSRPQSINSTRAMVEASRATSPTPLLTVTDFEGLPPVPSKDPPKKSWLLSAISWSTRITRRHPFLSAVLLYAVLTGIIAGVAKSSYNRDRREPDAKFDYSGNGVSFSSAPPTPVGFELTRRIVDCPPRIWLSDRH